MGGLGLGVASSASEVGGGRLATRRFSPTLGSGAATGANDGFFFISVAIPCASRNSVGMGQRCQWMQILDRGMENVPGERYRNTKETKEGAFVEEEEVLSWGVTFHVELYCKKVDCSAPKLYMGPVRRYVAQMGGAGRTQQRVHRAFVSQGLGWWVMAARGSLDENLHDSPS